MSARAGAAAAAPPADANSSSSSSGRPPLLAQATAAMRRSRSGSGSANSSLTAAPGASSVAAAPAAPPEPAPPAAAPASSGSPPPSSLALSPLPATQRADRLVMFLSTLVAAPFAFLLAQAASAAGTYRAGGVSGGGGIDTRKRLTDFPEGAALVDIEEWCRQPVYSSWVWEVAMRGAIMARHLVLALLPYPIVVQVLSAPWLLQVLGLHPYPSLAHVVDGLMPLAAQQLAAGNPQAVLAELQARTLPNLAAIKASLERRHRLVRGPTPLERLDFVTAIARRASRLFFMWLRGLARAATYLSSLLSVISGALSFTVVPSIILSVIAACLGVLQLGLMSTADLLEPAVNALLALTETSKATAASLGGTPESSPVNGRYLPPLTAEQLEPFFNLQLRQESGLLNRPEIPQLASLARPLLVKAYDLGLIDACGATESGFIRERLALAAAQSLMGVVCSAGQRLLLAGAALDAPALLTAGRSAASGVAGALLPSALGGGRASLRHLFRPDGFFAYADDRQAQVATVLLARLLSWLHLGQVVTPGSPACLRFVLVLGDRQAGKASLFARLVEAPPTYAAQLGGGSSGADGTREMGSAGGRPLSGQLVRSRSLSKRSAGAGGGGGSGSAPAAPSSTAAAPPPAAPAVDMRQLAGGGPNTIVVCFPGLNSPDPATRQLAQGLAAAMGRLAAAVVYLVHPAATPSPEALSLLAGPLAAGVRVLVAINGPGRVPGLTGLTAGSSSSSGGGAALGAGKGALLPQPASPLEALRSRWQAAAEAMAVAHGVPPSLLGVVVSDVLMDAPAAAAGGAAGGAGAGGSQGANAELLPVGVHHFRQVADWVASTAAQAQRSV